MVISPQKTEQKKDEFLFYIPIEVDKADEKGNVKIRGIASTEDKDDQGEVVFQDGLDISHLKAGKGLFNYDHNKGPENIIGEITAADKTNKGLSVEGYLFGKQPKAQAISNIMQSLKQGSEKRVKMSIEGKVIKRKGNKILSAKVNNVALTMNPINENTFAEFIKSFADTKDLSEEAKYASQLDSLESGATSSPSDSRVLISKAELAILINMAKAGLATGNYNVPPSQLSGGGALMTEDLDKKIKKLRKKYDKAQIIELAKIIGKSHPELSLDKTAEVAFQVYDHLVSEKLNRKLHAI